jgi:hypothetical protein
MKTVKSSFSINYNPSTDVYERNKHVGKKMRETGIDVVLRVGFNAIVQ